MSSARAYEIPVFPLEVAVLPGAVVPLHIFEPRYCRLARDLQTEAPAEFAVVPIERGREVGGGDRRFDVGVSAVVAEAREYPDGRWALLAVAGRRLSVQKWLPENPYPRASVTDRPDSASAVSGDCLEELRAAFEPLAQVMHAIDPRVDVRSVEILDDDPIRASWRFMVAASLGALDRVDLLRIDNPEHRVIQAAVLMRERREILEALHGP